MKRVFGAALVIVAVSGARLGGNAHGEEDERPKASITPSNAEVPVDEKSPPDQPDVPTSDLPKPSSAATPDVPVRRVAPPAPKSAVTDVDLTAYGLLNSEAERDSTIRTMLNEYQHTEDDARRAELIRAVTAMVARQFDVRQAFRNRELKRLEADLRALRDRHEKREKLRAEIVHNRVNQLLRESEGLGWGAGTGGESKERRATSQPIDNQSLRK